MVYLHSFLFPAADGMSGLPNSMAALYLGEVSTVSTEKEDVWAPQPIIRLWC